MRQVRVEAPSTRASPRIHRTGPGRTAPLATSGAPPPEGTPADRPNIVFILSDDHAYNALGIAGHPHPEDARSPSPRARGRLVQTGRRGHTALCAVTRRVSNGSVRAYLRVQDQQHAMARAVSAELSSASPKTPAIAPRSSARSTSTTRTSPCRVFDRWVSFVNQGLASSIRR